MISREETKQAALDKHLAAQQNITRSQVMNARMDFASGWDAAFAVQATETEALEAVVKEFIAMGDNPVPASQANERQEAIRRLCDRARRLTDRGTSPSQDAQEPT